MPKMKRIRSTLVLLLTAVIWGLAFVAQREGSKYIGPFTFNSSRFFLGSISLLPVILISERRVGREKRRGALWRAAVAGAILCVASNLQQLGINATQSAGKSAFITGLYTILVPIAYFLFFRRRTGLNVLFGAVLALVGLYLLCGSMGAIGVGDLYLFIGALFWTAHIMWIDHSTERDLPVVTFSAIQFASAGTLSAIPALFTETASVSSFTGAAIPILYAGIMSTGVAYTCQVIGQKHADPTTAAIVMSTESLWAALGGAVVLDETMTAAGIAGCALMTAGIVAAQIDPGKLRLEKIKPDR